jgi:armadillo repeat-containing protein 8
LSEICSLKELGRKKIIDSKVLPLIVNCLSHENKEMRIIACKCIKGLSRSTPHLRTCLIDSGVAEPLLKLMQDDSDSIKIISSACVCNIVMDFSPMKKFFIENKGVEILVNNTKSMNSILKLNSIWALKNLSFKSNLQIKKKIIQSLKSKGICE